MEADAVPVVLEEKLGLEASSALVRLFNRAEREWREPVLSLAAERFERRLVEETSKLRVEMARGFAALEGTLRTEMGNQRAELLKCAFLFWAGQVGAVAALLALMQRG